jgi:hypothetical protein
MPDRKTPDPEKDPTTDEEEAPSSETPSITGQQRLAILGGIVGGVVVAIILIWWLGGPSQATVQRTVVTTVQQETPASTLITGQLSMSTTVEVDSTSSLTPTWLTSVIRTAQPQLIPLTLGTASAQIRVPGTVSYGFDVRNLTSDMIRLVDDDLVEVRLPELNVQSVEPDLRRIEMQTASSGWMKMFTGDMEEEVRRNALSQVQEAFRTQAEARLNSTNQPGINTARALQAMLTPPLRAAGLDRPQFRFRIREDLVLTLDPSDHTDREDSDAGGESSSTSLPQAEPSQ